MRPPRYRGSMWPRAPDRPPRVQRCSLLATTRASEPPWSERLGCSPPATPPCLMMGQASPLSKPTAAPESCAGCELKRARRSVRPSAGCPERSEQSDSLHYAANMSLLPALTGSFSTPAADNPTGAMMDAAYAHHDIDARYVNCDVAAEDLADAVRGATAMGWIGFNCSLPHKVAVIQLLDELAESARLIGAVNCAVRRNRPMDWGEHRRPRFSRLIAHRCRPGWSAGPDSRRRRGGPRDSCRTCTRGSIRALGGEP